MLANLIVSGLSVLLLLRIVCKAWRRAFGIASARDLDKHATWPHGDSKRLKTGSAAPLGTAVWNARPHKYCHVR